MTSRRDFIIGGGCALAFGTAEWLRPRRMLDLLGDSDLNKLVPRRFGGWVSQEGGDFVIPQTPDSLSARLYTKQVTRTYRLDGVPSPVMLLIAYGSSQSDALQLHRPEACYRAVGFEIVQRRLGPIPLRGEVSVPGVELTAQAQNRIEDIVYWSRLGEFLPQTASQQRRDRLSAAMAGYVGDGVLVRASLVRPPGGEAVYPLLTNFLGQMVLAMPPASRSALIGTSRATTVEGVSARA